jgi:hypothetical protein
VTLTMTDAHVGRISRRAGVLRVAALDIAGPLAVFQLARFAGLPEVWSLVLAGLPPAVGVVIDWLRWHALDVVGAVVLGGVVLSLALAVASNDSAIVLLESAAVTAAFGIACLVSLGRRR